jgi:hypothetical protein
MLAIKRKDGSTVKKFLAMFMAFAMAASLMTVTVGCGDAKKDTKAPTTPPAGEKKDEKK